jgi:hypothetical protein
MIDKPAKRIRRPNNSVSIPIEFLELDEDSIHVVVMGSVNGHECRMILDTGASRTVADLAFVNEVFPEMEMEVNEQPSAGLGTNTMESHFFMAEEIIVGSKLMEGQLLAALDLSHVNDTYEMLGLPRIHLVLGSDILRAHKAIIDYGSKQLILG